MNRRDYKVEAMGFEFITKNKPFQYIENAFDYYKKVWSVPEFEAQLDYGNIPEGLLVRVIQPSGSYSRLGVVVGALGTSQSVSPFRDM